MTRGVLLQKFLFKRTPLAVMVVCALHHVFEALNG